MTTILKQYADLLNRDACGIIHFNDVFSNTSVDIDAELTARIRNLGNIGSDLTFPIGKQPRIADYSINLLNDLIEEQKRIISSIREKTGRIVGFDFSKKTFLSIINKADRNENTTHQGKNGEDFHLAITNHGLEIYVVPLARLQALETRNKILALYRIPNEKLPLTDGTKEQFRSSIIATTRYFPDILKPVFQYENVEELLKAKEENRHPNIIPTQEKLAEFAFADKFGNVRVSVKNNDKFKELLRKYNFNDKVKIRVGNYFIEAYYVTSLKEIPLNKIGIYQNVADEYAKVGYWEIVKKSQDCNNDQKSAFNILKRLNPNFEQEEIIIE